MYRKQNFLDGSLRRLLLNALIQPHFDYACTSWYPMLNKRLSKKIQAAQNKCIRFYLNLKNTAHIGATEFKAINWLPTKNRMDQFSSVHFHFKIPLHTNAIKIITTYYKATNYNKKYKLTIIKKFIREFVCREFLKRRSSLNR